MIQLDLFAKDPGPIHILAYGLGVDSTAILVHWDRIGVRPDFILFADVGSEKRSTYRYLPIIQHWLAQRRFPPVTVVRYIPQRAPYTTLEGNMVMNATLPGATFGKGSCTAKWKIAPQDKWVRRNGLCLESLYFGHKIKKTIGFDAGEDYRKGRANDKAHHGNDDYEYDYPLLEWGWGRDACKAAIREAGLPVPPKSSCIFCPNIKPEELAGLTPEERGRIVRMEVTAAPYNRKVHGLWRRPRKRDGRPGSITEYLIRNGLEFTHPDGLPDSLPLNPSCQKKPGRHPSTSPLGAPCLSDMLCELENFHHWDLIHSL